MDNESPIEVLDRERDRNAKLRLELALARAVEDTRSELEQLRRENDAMERRLRR